MIHLNQESPVAIRKFGIDLVGDIQWGTHICLLYACKQDLLDIMLPFCKTGLRNKEFCLWITAFPLDVEEAKKALKKKVPKLEQYIRKEQIEILSFNSWYGSNTKIDAEKISDALIEKVQIALNRGFEGLRIFGNFPTDKQLFSKSVWTNLTAYEKYLHNTVASNKILSLCAYPLGQCTAFQVTESEQLHSSTLVKRDSSWFFEDAEQRRISEESYRNIIQNSIDAFWIMDSEGNFLEVNKAYCDIVGYTREELLSMHLKDVELKETAEKIHAHMKKIRKTTNERFETRHLCKNGTAVDLEVSANYMSNDDKGIFYIFAHNITRRKRNEEIIKLSEIQYRELADSITDSFVALDKDLKYTYWNRATEKITGVPAKKALGHHLFEVFGKDEAIQKVAKVYQKALKAKIPQFFIEELIMGDSEIVAENHVYPTRTGVSVFIKDITQRKVLQKKLASYAQHLEDIVKIRTEKLKNAERLATIGEMAGMIGHDIRNPLQSISGELYLAKNELDSLSDSEAKKTVAESFAIIDDQLTYINKIISDLQDYAKPLMPYPEEIDLRKTIKEIMSSISIPQNMHVSVSIKKGLPTLKTDKSYLKRILTNLITNAIQAMPEDGQLAINADYKKRHAFISVHDTGEGIPEDVKTKIFKPLFTTKSKGQGFGLAVVKKLSDALGGKVTFESTVGTGTQFTVKIPICFMLTKNEST